VDRILISDLRLSCIIGVNDKERLVKQDVVINIAISADLRKAGMSDRFEDAVDYRDIKKKIVALVEGSRFFLVEALAEAVARICLEHPAAIQAVVRVEKPQALRFARTVGVEITRGREGSQFPS
jgi:FolB domain-containing protein